MKPTILKEEQINIDNLDEVLSIFDKCFRSKEEREAGRRLYKAFIRGQILYDATLPPHTIKLIGYWLHRDLHSPLGFSGLYEENRKLWIGWFGVDPAQSRRGIGTEILNFVKEKARGLKFDELHVFVAGKDSVAQAFYLFNNFHELEEAKFNGWNLKIFRCNLEK